MPRAICKPSPRSTPPADGAYLLGDWRQLAACRDHRTLPASTWDDSTVGVNKDPARAKRVAQAKAVCRTECSVREACLDAVDLDYDEGIRGGEDIRDLWAARRRTSA